MPFIRTSLNITLSASQEEALKKRFGEAIACIPGKSENWLMLEFSDNCRMWFKGEQAPMAMVDVSIFGGAWPEAYEALTAKLTGILAEVVQGLASDRIYIKYSEYSHWGWNGGNF